MIPGWSEADVYAIASRGHALMVQGRYREAQVIFEGLLAVDPRNSYCANALAALHISQGEIARAIDVLSDALVTDPRNLESRARRCECYLMMGRVAEAIQDGEILRRAMSREEFARFEVLLNGRR
jgi:tetratricopeptide (TPR) repeat protein